MAKKKLKQKQIAIAAVAIIVAMVFLSYLSYTGYASVFRQTMGGSKEFGDPSRPSMGPHPVPVGAFRISCTESCTIKTVTLYTRQQATFCCDVIELKSVSSNGDVVVTVTDGYRPNKDYSVYCRNFESCQDNTVTLDKDMPTCTESITNKEKVLDVNVEVIRTKYSDDAHESSATLKLSKR